MLGVLRSHWENLEAVWKSLWGPVCGEASILAIDAERPSIFTFFKDFNTLYSVHHSFEACCEGPVP